MTVVAIAICVFIVAMGATGLASPQRLFGFVRRFQSPWGLFVGGGIRVALGVSLFLVAPDTRAPEVLRPLGAFLVLAGFLMPLFGPARFGGWIDWWSRQSDAFARAWSAFAVAFGAGLAWLVLAA